MKVYTITGHSGNSLDENSTDWEALRAQHAALDLGGLDGDHLEYGAELLEASPAGVILPDEGQLFELHQSGTKIFRGHVESIEYTHRAGGRNSAAVRVVGPDWWMRRITLTDAAVADQAGDTDERAIVTFAEGNVTAHLGALFTRAQALGCPIDDDDSGLANCFTVPRLTFSVSSCWDVLVELLRWVPDAMFWWDYSGALPVPRLARRGTAATLAYAVGSEPLEGVRIRKNVEKEVSKVVIPYAARDAQGRVIWEKLESGTEEVGKRQIVTGSGPELDTFLPIDLVDSVEVATTPVAGANWNFVKAADPLVVEAGSPNLNTGPSSIGPFHNTSAADDASPAYVTIAAPTSLGEQGQSTAGKHIIISETTLPDWLAKQEAAEPFGATYKGVGYYLWVEYYDPDGTDGSSIRTYYPQPDYVTELGMVLIKSGWRPAGGSPQVERIHLYTYEFTIPVTVVSQNWATAQTIYRDPEYGFIFPPATLAADLLAAQNFAPWEGTVSLLSSGEAVPVDVLGHKLNLTGGHPEWATMGALVQGLRMDLAQGEAAVKLGAPDRLSSRSLAERFSQSGQDNIVPL